MLTLFYALYKGSYYTDLCGYGEKIPLSFDISSCVD